MRAFALSFCLALSMTVLLAGDPWPHPACDKEHSFYTTAPALPDAGVHWVIEDIADCPSTVIDASGNIYVFHDDDGSYSVVSLNPATGEVVDTYVTGVATPGAMTLSSGMLYVLADRALMAWQVGNTTMQWSKHPEDLYTVPVADDSGNVCVAGYGCVYCYATDGTQNWSYTISASYVGGWPAITNNGVFMPVDTDLLGINIVGGSERFSYDAAGAGYDYFVGPTAGPDQYIWAGFVASGAIDFYGAFRNTDGYPGEYFIFSDKSVRLHCITGTNIFIFQGGNRLYVWDVTENEPDVDLYVGFNSSPITCASGTMYLGDEDGRLYAYDLTGSLDWSIPVGDASSSTTWYKAVDADGNIYVSLEGGKLAKIGPDISGPDIDVTSVVISGYVDDDFTPPPQVLVDGTPVPVNPGDGTFQAEVPLSANPQTIEVRASDANSNETVVNVGVAVN